MNQLLKLNWEIPQSSQLITKTEAGTGYFKRSIDWSIGKA